jgi:formate hydrogenlyase subunit 6/NADH:ubiquinone oxidoreductase subunit I
MNGKVYMTPNPPTPNKGQRFDAILCNGCNSCVEVCPTDVMMPNPEKEKPPIVLYPEECWFCGACIEECGTGALSMSHPLSQNISVNWKRKETDAYYRLGMKNPPAPNRRPPSGGRDR